MLKFKLKDNKLIVKANKEFRKELKECDGYKERENLIRENYYEPEYDFKTADDILGQFSEAPVFASELNYRDDGYIEFYDDCPAYFYNEYMINDFTKLLMKGKKVIFNKI